MVQQKRGYATVGDDGSDEEGDSPASRADGSHAQLEQHAVHMLCLAPPSHKSKFCISSLVSQRGYSSDSRSHASQAV